MNLYSFPWKERDKLRVCLSILDPAVTPNFKNSAVLGYLIDEKAAVIHENIHYNPQFIDIFHKVIVLTTLRSHETAAQASLQETGFIYITDQRNTDTKTQNPEDIIGSFEVLNGSLQPLSYQPNPKYKLVSTKGLFSIPGDFDKFLELAVLSQG